MTTEADAKRSPLVRAADRAKVPEEEGGHPLNPNAKIRGWSLSDLAGLQRTALHLLTIPAGKESFVYHSHQTEEEFLSSSSSSPAAAPSRSTGRSTRSGRATSPASPRRRSRTTCVTRTRRTSSTSRAASAAPSRSPTTRGTESGWCGSAMT